ncbi:MAG: hypothetical protein ACRDTC_17645, partial [Pseudonocardiaceae bacterium]
MRPALVLPFNIQPDLVATMDIQIPSLAREPLSAHTTVTSVWPCSHQAGGRPVGHFEVDVDGRDRSQGADELPQLGAAEGVVGVSGVLGSPGRIAAEHAGFVGGALGRGGLGQGQ